MTTSKLTELTTAEQNVVCGGLATSGIFGSFDHSKGFGNITKQTNNLVQTSVALNLGGGETESNAWSVQKNVNDIF